MYVCPNVNAGMHKTEKQAGSFSNISGVPPKIGISSATVCLPVFCRCN